MDKRAEFSALAKIVLLVVFALLIIAAVTNFVIFLDSQSAENLCSQSIIKSGLDGVPDFECKAERITISRDDLNSEANGRLDEDGLEDAVKRKVANEMYACWKKTGRGIIDPYKKTFEVKNFAGSSGAAGHIQLKFFLICEIVEFKDLPDFNGLMFWMIHNKPIRADEPYFDLVLNRNPTEEEIDVFEKEEDIYETSRLYAVAWEHDPKSSENKNSIVFMPYEELMYPEDDHVFKYIPIVMN